MTGAFRQELSDRSFQTGVFRQELSDMNFQIGIFRRELSDRSFQAGAFRRELPFIHFVIVVPKSPDLVLKIERNYRVEITKTNLGRKSKKTKEKESGKTGVAKLSLQMWLF